MTLRGPNGEIVPEWLALIRIARYRAGQPTIRDIAKMSHVKRETVSGLFNGKTHPDEDDFENITSVLTVGRRAEYTEIMAAFDDASCCVPKPQRRPFPPLEFRTDAQIIADAITRAADTIAAAIRDTRQNP